MEQPMISGKKISFQYKGSDPISFPDFEFEKGEHALILGDSGCGKTTLMHIIAGMLQPQSGKATIDNTVINQL